jgi:hypothetical protein
MSSRTTLKSYFLSGASPTEANFADLIDSVLVIDEDLIDGFTSTSTTDALSANAGKTLNDSLVGLTSRVVTLEGASTDYLSSYYTKSEIDSSLTSIGTTIDSKASVTSLNDLSSTVSGIQTSLNGKANTSHTHVISEVTSLQSTLDDKATKAYVDSTKAYLQSQINSMGSGGSSYDDTAITARVTTLESNASSYATIAQLATKANTVHGHTVSDISDLDLNEYYNKTSVDGLLANIEPKEHTHTESEITDLDKYTKATTDLKIGDHSDRTDNPHGVTKAQVSLGNVENLSVVSLFQTPQAQLLATRAEVGTLESELDAHIAQDNPHGVTKVQVSLGNVPNIDVNALLNAHLAADNPHNLSTSLLDVYSKAETQTKIEENYDAHRYNYTPSSATDSAGAVGDFAYDSNKVYFKFGPTDWRQLVAGSANTSSDVTEIETDTLEVAGSDGETYFEVDTATSGGDSSTTLNTTNMFITGGSSTTNLFEVKGGTTNVTEINTTVVSIGGSTFNTFNVSENFKINNVTNVTEINNTNVSIGGSTFNTFNVSENFKINNTTAVTEINNTRVSIGGSTFNTFKVSDLFQIDNSTQVTNIDTTHVSLGGDTFTTQGAVTFNDTLNVTNHSTLNSVAVTSLNAGGGTIQTTGTIQGGATTVTSLSAGSGTISTTGSITGGATSVTSLNAGSGAIQTTGTLKGGATNVTSLTSSGSITGTNLTLSGNLTVNGTTTTIDTTNLLIEDNMVVLNKNQTGTPSSSLDSGIEVERGNSTNAKLYWDEATDRWKVNLGGTVKTLAFAEDLYSA